MSRVWAVGERQMFPVQINKIDFFLIFIDNLVDCFHSCGAVAWLRRVSLRPSRTIGNDPSARTSKSIILGCQPSVSSTDTPSLSWSHA
jgi:hypothetical protein